MKVNHEKLDGQVLSQYKKRSEILKAMAHPTRLYILDMLKNGSLCVCEINDMIDADVSTISKHLSVLKVAGLVSSEKQGLQVYYTLRTKCVLDYLGCIEGVIQSNV